MTWHAKPADGYDFDTTENYDNSMEIYGILNAQAYNVAAIAGVCGNAQHESGLNPWRWQGDSVGAGYKNGYGLLQWTPATGYIYLSGATPNLSVSGQTQGATPEDGARQIQAFYENNPAKWTTSCWRSYWNTATYAEYYAKTRYILLTWGSGSTISLDQFKNIDDPAYAADCFLACFEGPAVPNYGIRESTAALFYERFSGSPPPTPPTPPTPPPPPVVTDSLWWLLKRLADLQNTSLILK